MATHQINNISIAVPAHVIEYAKRRCLEGASQAWTEEICPIVVTAGLGVKAADPVTALHGFAMRPANNDAGGISLLEYVLAIDGLVLIGNHLDTDGTDNTLVQADFGALRQLNETASIGPGSTTVWHLGDSATTAAAYTIDQDGDYFPAPTEPTYTKVGDVNARVPFVVKASVKAWA